MNIAMVGYGKMGHIIETIAVSRTHCMVATIDSFADDASVHVKNTGDLVHAIEKSGADVVIEFTHPSAVMDNIKALLPLGIPVVVGTTGWMNELSDVRAFAGSCGGTLFYAANYSIGVTMFYRMVEYAAGLMAGYDEYDVALWEAHHRQKADSPSGTALDLAKAVMKANLSKTSIVTDAFYKKPEAHELHVSSTRVGSVPGTHSVFFDSFADSIELRHTARNREGFALGAVRAAEWLYVGRSDGSLKNGSLYTMDDMLG